ncbi:MAG: competence/damage-inducible protein A [Ignavibacteria bacterium]|nr:competence/damage-inducible protein A [Ignavibacteria bacterium]
MRSVILSIGDEVLIGQVVNTNASYLGSGLFSLGIPAEKIITLPDNEKEILKEFRSAWKNFDVIVVTGGLGPTHDDITKKCVAEFFKSEYVLNEKVLKHVKSIFARRHIQMPAVNIGQALVPSAAIVLENKAGTAPGLLIDKADKVFCVLPGVPYEMKYISEKGLFPYLEKKYRNKVKRVVKQKTLHTIGIGESLLAAKLGDIGRIVRKGRDYEVKLAFLPSNYEVRLRITVSAATLPKANSLVNSTLKLIKKAIDKFIYSDDEGSIEKTLGALLKKKRLTISAAESCTGGLIASKLTDIAGSSAYVMDGIVSYADKAKKRLLGVKPGTIKKYGAVSRETALEMAVGIRKRSDTDIGISATGIAGPGGARKNKPVGLVWIGYSDKNITFAKDFIFTKDRLRNKDAMAKMALEVVRRQLLSINN